MLEFREVPHTNIVEFTVAGKITPEEFQAVVPKFLAAAEKHEKIRLLKEVRDIETIDPAMFGQQIGEMFTHLGDITHAALVADKQWEPAVKAMGSVYPFEMRFFELPQIEEAREWLRTAE